MLVILDRQAQWQGFLGKIVKEKGMLKE